MKVENIHVFYEAIPDGMGDRTLYPEERMAEIEKCKSEKVRREKYWAWVLLEKALKEALNIDIENLQFTKTPSGKWIADGCCFSLSHTDGAMAAAVSGSAVGVDIEAVRELAPGIEQKILTERETACFAELTDGERQKYLLERWCEKEAIFKSQGRDALMPRTLEASEYGVHTERVFIDGREYVLSYTAAKDK